MKQPWIGITPMVDKENEMLWLRPGYMNAVLQAGGLPLMLPLDCDTAAMEAYVRLCDGFLFPGGADLNPQLYGQQPHPAAYPPCPERDRMECELLKLALKADKAVLCICRGMQLLNVALGGSLWQDIPAQRPAALEHRMNPPFGRPVHSVSLLAGSPIQNAMGCEKLDVNSDHHQAIMDLAPSLTAMAWAEDGIIESVFLPEKRFVWGVQWHPEAFPETDQPRYRLFRAFIRGAGGET